MKNHHKKLVFADRISIQNLLKAKQSVPHIAAHLRGIQNPPHKSQPRKRAAIDKTLETVF